MKIDYLELPALLEIIMDIPRLIMNKLEREGNEVLAKCGCFQYYNRPKVGDFRIYPPRMLISYCMEDNYFVDFPPQPNNNVISIHSLMFESIIEHVRSSLPFEEYSYDEYTEHTCLQEWEYERFDWSI